MRTLVIALLLIVSGLPTAACAGELSVTSPVFNGEVAILRWQGERPSFGVARFRDQVVYLYPDPGGAIALLPIPLDAQPGTEALLVSVVDRSGDTTAAELSVEVLDKERPVEHLTLPPRMVTPDPEDLKRIERERARLEAVFAARTVRHWDVFRRPVEGQVSSVFGKRRLMNNLPRAPHSGTDFRGPTGTPVRALSAGRVAYIGDLFYTGQTVVLDHGEGLFSLYAHLSAIDVADGDLLESGTVLGKIGSTGRSTGPHLHLTVRLLGARIDPMALLAALTHQDS